uniref:MULE transposase domain-containing protein n=1 Tax=Tanacetum cinerariifolium TaxID=118510 RepID=A0A699GLZ3_TANCI|nr:hypothetical protein [Tanacetum cinerariifolium]
MKMEIMLEPTSNKPLVGDDDRLVGLFRADEKAIKNYATFGDIVSFDAIFRSNKINHHYYSITFASGLLADEIAEAYIWLLKQFKEAFGKDPEIVVTDQDPSMKIAIAECFPNKAPSMYVAHNDKVGHEGVALCNRTDFKRRIYDIVWTDQISPEVFKREWECMINKFELGENKCKWTSPHLTLIELLSHYDTAIDYQMYIERKNDHDSRYKTPAFKTDLLMVKEACKLYTRTLFFYVQDEMFASYKYCIALFVV